MPVWAAFGFSSFLELQLIPADCNYYLNGHVVTLILLSFLYAIRFSKWRLAEYHGGQGLGGNQITLDSKELGNLTVYFALRIPLVMREVSCEITCPLGYRCGRPDTQLKAMVRTWVSRCTKGHPVYSTEQVNSSSGPMQNPHHTRNSTTLHQRPLPSWRTYFYASLKMEQARFLWTWRN